MLAIPRSPARIRAAELFLIVLPRTSVVIGYSLSFLDLLVLRPPYGSAGAYSMPLTFPLVNVTFIFRSVYKKISFGPAAAFR